LTVGKNGSIVTFEDIGDDGCGSIFVNLILFAGPVEHGIKRELLGWLVSVGSAHEGLTCFFIHFHHNLVPFVYFVTAHWAATNTNLDTFGLCLFDGGGG